MKVPPQQPPTSPNGNRSKDIWTRIVTWMSYVGWNTRLSRQRCGETQSMTGSIKCQESLTTRDVWVTQRASPFSLDSRERSTINGYRLRTARADALTAQVLASNFRQRFLDALGFRIVRVQL